METKSVDEVLESHKSYLKRAPQWNGIKNRKLTLQEKHFSGSSFVRKHLNFDVYNPVYTLSRIGDSKVLRLWVMLFDVLKEAAKHDLGDREKNLFNKWEIATVVLSKENQNGPLSQELLNVLELRDYRLPREFEKIKFILLNFLNLGAQCKDEFIKSQVMHGCSPYSILVHVTGLISNLGNRLGSLDINDPQPTSLFTNRILWIASKFSCPHSIIWSHAPDGKSHLDPLVIWKCKFSNKNCDGVMASMMTKNIIFLDTLCKESCQKMFAQKDRALF